MHKDHDQEQSDDEDTEFISSPRNNRRSEKHGGRDYRKFASERHRLLSEPNQDTARTTVNSHELIDGNMILAPPDL